MDQDGRNSSSIVSKMVARLDANDAQVKANDAQMKALKIEVEELRRKVRRISDTCNENIDVETLDYYTCAMYML